MGGVLIPNIQKICWDLGTNVVSFPDSEEVRDAVRRGRSKRRGELEIVRHGMDFVDTWDDVVRFDSPPSSTISFHDITGCTQDEHVAIIGTPVLRRHAVTIDVVDMTLTID